MTPREYIDKVKLKEIYDPVLKKMLTKPSHTKARAYGYSLANSVIEAFHTGDFKQSPKPSITVHSKEIELGINGSQWGISERIYDFGTGLIHSYSDGELNTYQLNILRYRSIDEMKIWVEKFSIRTCRDAELEDFYDGVFREFSSELPEGVELREKIDSAGDCYDNAPYVDLYTLNNGEFSWFIEAYGYLICRDKNAIRETWSESLSRAFSKKAILSDFMRGD